ncbi:MAG: hypothetical protein B1H12_02280 [Desulfobacteraceae bacterium 4484_190.2]|nr:MAG: hypothetical protein B1H12_02280 [Desulfobacteraceae bacterium 4484_190.2]
MQELFYAPISLRSRKRSGTALQRRFLKALTLKLMQEQAKKYGMVIIVPVYEEEITGVYYNTAAIFDAEGTYLGKYRKNHIPPHTPVFGKNS